MEENNPREEDSINQAAQSFHLTYTHTFNDWLCAIRAHRRPWYARLIVLYLLAFLGLFVYFVIAHPDVPFLFYLTWPVPLGYFIGLIVFLFLAVFTIDFLFDHLVYRLYYRRYLIAGKRMDIDVGADGLNWSMENTKGSIGWSTVVRRVVGPDHLILFMSKMDIFVLPRRAVSAQDWPALLAFVRERMRKAREG